MYSASSVLVWDPSAYNGSLEEWYNKPDWPFFEQFFSKRLMQPEDSLYLLNPGTSIDDWNGTCGFWYNKPTKLLAHPGLDYGRFTHTLRHSTYKYLSTNYY